MVENKGFKDRRATRASPALLCLLLTFWRDFIMSSTVPGGSGAASSSAGTSANHGQKRRHDARSPSVELLERPPKRTNASVSAGNDGSKLGRGIMRYKQVATPATAEKTVVRHLCGWSAVEDPNTHRCSRKACTLR